ncbi:MAG: hypothetical protein R2911_42540 [Caldilineaceae bacterium]
MTIVETPQAYFALSVKSCWLVEPITDVGRVYHPQADPKTFASGEVIDDVVGIKIPVAEIFE